MIIIRIETEIAAAPARCFDLARSVDAHISSAGSSGEKVVGGRMAGLLEMGEEVTWEGRHFGIRQRLTSRITAFDRPNHFQDRMIRGAFKFLEHDHYFNNTVDGGTIMIDVVRFGAPFGLIGWIAERVLLAGHLRRFLQTRGSALKSMAEAGVNVRL